MWHPRIIYSETGSIAKKAGDEKLITAILGVMI